MRLMGIHKGWAVLFATAGLCAALPARAQSVAIDSSQAGREQTIDGFGTCLSGTEGQQAWFQQLYFDDMQCSMLRMDIVPHFKAPYSDLHYNSPWFGQAAPMDLPGPDGNNVRTYTSASDYTNSFGGQKAQIAVMGPDIDKNVQYFNYDDDGPRTAGLLAQIGKSKQAQLGDFKLFASMWSPAPWLKLSSGSTISGQSDPLPKNGTAWPFIWGGNFSGGVLDTSGTPRAEFDDSSLGGTGPTSALTQFARGLAAYLRGFQQKYGVKLYAISIQNELNFETFYNSCSYPHSDAYIKALKAARAELDKYPDLKSIRIMGPEDLLGGDGYGMWEYGGGNNTTHKNLQYLQNIAADPDADKALDFFCIHGYAADGVNAAGATPQQWDWWVNGWSSSPAAGLPASVKGFASYGKKSWMTETSGEQPDWLSPASGFPGKGAWSIALKIEQALTAGQESAWAYWQMSDGKAISAQTLTDSTLKDTSPKYIAAKHFFRFIRPGAVRVDATVSGSTSLAASAYVHDANGTLVIELVNASAQTVTASIDVPAYPAQLSSFDVVTSSDGKLWQTSTLSATGGKLSVDVPGYGVVTLDGQGVGNGGSSGAGGTAGAAGSGAGGGGNSGATGTGGNGAGGPGGANSTPAGSDNSSGCGCRTAGSHSSNAPAFALLALFGCWLVRRDRD
jgi:O-glycosyl hydrolase